MGWVARKGFAAARKGSEFGRMDSVAVRIDFPAARKDSVAVRKDFEAAGRDSEVERIAEAGKVRLFPEVSGLPPSFPIRVSKPLFRG